MRRLLFVYFCLPLSAIAEIRFIPSNAPVKRVILSHFSTVPSFMVDSRLKLIEDVHQLFPKVEIAINSDLSREELAKRFPELVKVVATTVTHDARNIQDPFEFVWDVKEKKNAALLFTNIGAHMKTNLE